MSNVDYSLVSWKASWDSTGLKVESNAPNTELEKIALDIGIMEKSCFERQDSEEEIREKISRLENYLKKLEQIDLPLKHVFTTGIYTREIFIPKGSIVVGKIHRHDHVNFISSGDVTMLTKDGLSRIKGPCTMVSTEGTKRALYAHEDTIWTTIHSNPEDERDMDKLENMIIAPSYDDLLLTDQRFEVLP